MSKLPLSSPPPLQPLARTLVPLAWLLVLVFCGWVAAALFWQLAAPTPVASVAHHEPDARKVAASIGLHLGRPTPVAASALAHGATADPRYTVTGIATGFGTLPGFVILQVADGSTLNLSPGQALPDGRVLARLLPDAAEFELGGQRTFLALPQLGSERGEVLLPPTPVTANGPLRNH